MSPESFQALLDRATDAPPPPPAPGRGARRRAAPAAAASARHGRRRGRDHRRGRRRGLRRDDRARLRPCAGSRRRRPRTDDQASLLDSCRQGNQSRKATAAVFGRGHAGGQGRRGDRLRDRRGPRVGRRRLLGRVLDPPPQRRVRLGDDRLPVRPGRPGRPGRAGQSLGTSYTTGGGCALVDGDLPPECQHWFVQWVDRLPRDVAAVRFDLADGTTTTVPSRDGYVILNVLNQVAGDVRYDPRGRAGRAQRDPADLLPRCRRGPDRSPGSRGPRTGRAAPAVDVPLSARRLRSTERGVVSASSTRRSDSSATRRASAGASSVSTGNRSASVATSAAKSGSVRRRARPPPRPAARSVRPPGAARCGRRCRRPRRLRAP